MLLMAVKGNTSARLFGNAVAGVKDVKSKSRVVISRMASARIRQTGLLASAAAVEGRRVKMTASTGKRQVRGRGVSIYASVHSTGKAATISMPGPRKAVLTAAQRGRVPPDDSTPPLMARRTSARPAVLLSGGFNRQRQWPASDADAPRRWKHDHFDGPRVVGSSVFVRNLPHGVVTAEHLASLFNAVGQVASVKVDNGPLPTATVDFVRQDTALEAEKRFHGQWVQGSQLKVSAKSKVNQHDAVGDEDSWKRDLRLGASTRRRISMDDGVSSLGRRVKGRGSVAFTSRQPLDMVSPLDRLA